MAFGGVSNHSLRDMTSAHKKLVERGLSDADFDAVFDDLLSTLEELKVPRDIIDEAMALVESQRDAVLCRINHNVTPSKPLSDAQLESEGFNQFTLLERQREEGCEENYCRLKFKPHADFLFRPGNHLQIIAEIGGKWIQRSYTPVSDPENEVVELLLKIFPNGPMSQYLTTVPIGCKIWMKGPNGHFTYRSGIAQKINMFACGSGITPMWQIIKAVTRNPNDNTEVVLIHGCRNENELALRRELNELVAKHSNIRISQTLSLPSPQWRGLIGRISQENMKMFNPFNSDQNPLNLLCGTDDFVTHLKKVLRDGGHQESNLTIF